MLFAERELWKPGRLPRQGHTITSSEKKEGEGQEEEGEHQEKNFGSKHLAGMRKGAKGPKKKKAESLSLYRGKKYAPPPQRDEKRKNTGCESLRARGSRRAQEGRKEGANFGKCKTLFVRESNVVQKREKEKEKANSEEPASEKPTTRYPKKGNADYYSCLSV